VSCRLDHSEIGVGIQLDGVAMMIRTTGYAARARFHYDSRTETAALPTGVAGKPPFGFPMRSGPA
jgi:hypothetical protein